MRLRHPTFFLPLLMVSCGFLLACALFFSKELTLGNRVEEKPFANPFRDWRFKKKSFIILSAGRSLQLSTFPRIIAHLTTTG
jgi:hypothetical protein